MKKLADDQCPSINEGSITISHIMSKQPFTMLMDWPEIGCLMEVSIMYDIMHILPFNFVRQKYSGDFVHIISCLAEHKMLLAN